MPMGVSNSNAVDFFTFMWYNQFDKLEFVELNLLKKHLNRDTIYIILGMRFSHRFQSLNRLFKADGFCDFTQKVSAFLYL